MSPEDRWALIRRLKEAVHRAPFARVEEVGRLVVEHCFANDLRAWRDRNPRKCASYRKLADDPRLPLSKSSLQRDTGVYVALRTLPADVVRGRSVTHVAAVLSLDEPMRVQFLQLAKERNMSTRSLQEAVVEFRRKAGERRGRPLVRPLRRFMPRSGSRSLTGVPVRWAQVASLRTRAWREWSFTPDSLRSIVHKSRCACSGHACDQVQNIGYSDCPPITRSTPVLRQRGPHGAFGRYS
jgi:hypothetical protein